MLVTRTQASILAPMQVVLSLSKCSFWHIMITNHTKKLSLVLHNHEELQICYQKYIMRKIIYLIAFCGLISNTSYSQAPQWVFELPTNNQQNPTMVNSHLLPDDQNGFYLITVSENKMSYGLQFLGNISISHINDNGIIIGQEISWEGKATIHKASIFDNGNLLLTGMYYDSLILSAQWNFIAPQNHYFMVILSPNGEILYAEDMEDDMIASSIALENGSYALLKTEFGSFDDYLIRYNSQFQASDSIFIDNEGFLTGLETDASGNLQVLGVCSNDNMQVNNSIIYTLSGYNAYVVQLDESDEIKWFFQYEDITCTPTDVHGSEQHKTLVSNEIFVPTLIGNDSIQGPLAPSYGNTDFFLASIDSAGYIEWTLETPNNNGNGNFHIAINNSVAKYNEEYVVLAQFFGDSTIWSSGHTIIDTFNQAYSVGTPALLFVSENGEVTGSKLFKGGEGLFLHDIQTDNSGNIFISGVVNQPAQFDNLEIVADYNAQKFFVVKLASSTTDIVKEPPTQEINIYPNPVSEFVSISFQQAITPDTKLILHDLSGKIVAIEKIQSNLFNYTFNVSHFEKGIYFIEIQMSDNLVHKKLIIK